MHHKLTSLRREVFGPTPEAEDELAALWSEVFGQPPPLVGAPRLLASVLIRSLPPAPPYEFGDRPVGDDRNICKFDTQIAPRRARKD